MADEGVFGRIGIASGEFVHVVLWRRMTGAVEFLWRWGRAWGWALLIESSLFNGRTDRGFGSAAG